MKLSDVAKWLDVPAPSNELTLTGVSIDSRQIKPGELFVALPGERFDGHDYIREAVSRGAAAVMTMRQHPEITVPQLQVEDSLQSLTKLAKLHRQDMSCQVIALTGSNGKTTVKEMIALILPPPAHATIGNLNNHIGVPLSVLRLSSQHRYAVFELGANHQNEIAHTVSVVKPHVTLINNIAPAHIEGFGSIEGVAKAKGEIHGGLLPGGTAVINEDDDFAHAWEQHLEGKQVIRFSLGKDTPIHVEDIRYTHNGFAQFQLVTPYGSAPIQLQVPGQHNVSNALAAASCTLALGIEFSQVIRGLTTFTGVRGRMTFLAGKYQSVVIDDTYNANLRSVLMALEVLAKRPGQRIFVFGDMGELGKWSKEHHRKVGETARQLKIDNLLTCGTYSAHATKAFGRGAQHYPSQEALLTDLLNISEKSTSNQGLTILVKGSRASKMENIVQGMI